MAKSTFTKVKLINLQRASERPLTLRAPLKLNL